jgi:hypothetical protein
LAVLDRSYITPLAYKCTHAARLVKRQPGTPTRYPVKPGEVALALVEMFACVPKSHETARDYPAPSRLTCGARLKRPEAPIGGAAFEFRCLPSSARSCESFADDVVIGFSVGDETQRTFQFDRDDLARFDTFAAGAFFAGKAHSLKVNTVFVEPVL